MLLRKSDDKLAVNLAHALTTTMRPLLDSRAKVATARSISAGSAALIGLNSTAGPAAAACSTAHCPMPAPPASRSTAARVMTGTSSLSSSSHLPVNVYSTG